MAARLETTPIPNLPGYTFGERLGAGSYGRNFFNNNLFQVNLFVYRNCI